MGFAQVSVVELDRTPAPVDPRFAFNGPFPAESITVQSGATQFTLPSAAIGDGSVRIRFESGRFSEAAHVQVSTMGDAPGSCVVSRRRAMNQSRDARNQSVCSPAGDQPEFEAEVICFDADGKSARRPFSILVVEGGEQDRDAFGYIRILTDRLTGDRPGDQRWRKRIGTSFGNLGPELGNQERRSFRATFADFFDTRFLVTTEAHQYDYRLPTDGMQGSYLLNRIRASACIPFGDGSGGLVIAVSCEDLPLVKDEAGVTNINLFVLKRPVPGISVFRSLSPDADPNHVSVSRDDGRSMRVVRLREGIYSIEVGPGAPASAGGMLVSADSAGATCTIVRADDAVSAVLHCARRGAPADTPFTLFHFRA